MDKIVPPKLRWACRRGMLELDILLGQYLENVYVTLPEQGQAHFVLLLDSSDQDLFHWLMGVETPSDPILREMVTKVRDYARHHA